MGLLLLLVFSLLFTSVAPINAHRHRHRHHHHHHHGRTIRLPLHHSSPDILPTIPFSTIIRHDDGRVRSIYTRISKKSSTVGPACSDMSSPLSPGTSFGIGNYVTHVSLGTPSAAYPMVVDTGSSLTWLQCKPCNVSCHDQTVPLFDPSLSSSSSLVPCSSPICHALPSATLNPDACSPTNACIYGAIYGDDSSSVGFLSRDTLRIGSVAVPNFVFGCGQDNQGLFGRAAGIVGLARNRLSFISQAKSRAGAYAFSYCLPTAASTGSLSLGRYDASRFSFTPMVDNYLEDTLYFINLTGIAVAGKLIDVPSPSSYDTPTIIDSGTVITRLPPDVYGALKAAVAAEMTRRYEKAPGHLILDTCFVGSVDRMAVPEVSLVFDGGAEMRLPGRNVLIDVDSKRTCLAFAPATRIPIIGNRQQQTITVVYDVDRARIGFAAGGCG